MHYVAVLQSLVARENNANLLAVSTSFLKHTRAFLPIHIDVIHELSMRGLVRRA